MDMHLILYRHTLSYMWSNTVHLSAVSIDERLIHQIIAIVNYIHLPKKITFLVETFL